jgi:hypothetical protein
VFGALVAPLVIAAAGCAPSEVVEEAPPPPARTGCKPGQITASGGTCIDAGIAPGACAAGFKEDAKLGCVPVLPAAPCKPGQFAVPGESACHEPTTCPGTVFGNPPPGSKTQHVDASYTPATMSDGSVDRPWTTIQAGIDAASPGEVVAVAAGNYVGDLKLGRGVKLWGRCASMVTITGVTPANSAIVVGPGGGEIRGVAVTGTNIGIYFDHAAGAVDGVWVHDTKSVGILFDGAGERDAPGTVAHTLVENAALVGILAQGANATVDASVVRNTQPLNGKYGRGVQVQRASTLGSWVRITGSLVEGSRETAVFANGTEVEVLSSVLRDTTPAPGVQDAHSFQGQVDPKGNVRSKMLLKDSVVFGQTVQSTGCDLRIENSVIRDTAQSGNYDQRGLVAGYMPGTKESATVDIRQSLIVNAAEIGIFARGAALTITGSAVVDTALGPDGFIGDGALGFYDPLVPASTFDIRDSRFERNHSFNIALIGCDAKVDHTLIADALPRTYMNDGFWGRGIQAQSETGHVSTLTVTNSALLRNYESGILALSAKVTVSDTEIADTKPGSTDMQLGDGLDIMTQMGGPVGSADLQRITVRGSKRAGIASFGADVKMKGIQLGCNAIPINGDAFSGSDYAFTDGGGNVCTSCAGAVEPCKVLSANLTAPGEPAQPPK